MVSRPAWCPTHRVRKRSGGADRSRRSGGLFEAASGRRRDGWSGQFAGGFGSIEVSNYLAMWLGYAAERLGVTSAVFVTRNFRLAELRRQKWPQYVALADSQGF